MDHNELSSTDESMFHQTHGVTKWCCGDKGTDRLQ